MRASLGRPTRTTECSPRNTVSRSGEHCRKSHAVPERPRGLRVWQLRIVGRAKPCRCAARRASSATRRDPPLALTIHRHAGQPGNPAHRTRRLLALPPRTRGPGSSDARSIPFGGWVVSVSRERDSLCRLDRDLVADVPEDRLPAAERDLVVALAPGLPVRIGASGMGLFALCSHRRTEARKGKDVAGGACASARAMSSLASWSGPGRWRDPDSNRGHHDFQSCALPTELSRRAGQG